MTERMQTQVSKYVRMNYVCGSILGTRHIYKAHRPPRVAYKRPHV